MSYTTIVAVITSLLCLNQAFSEQEASLEYVKEEISPSSTPPLLDLEKELLSLEEELFDSEISFLDQTETPHMQEEESFSTPVIDPEYTLTTEEMLQAPALEEAESILEEVAVLSSAIMSEETAPTNNVIAPETPAPPVKNKIEVSFKQVFVGSPFIYSLLLSMSFISLAVCLYSILRIKEQNAQLGQCSKEIRAKLIENNFSEASNFCQNHPTLLSRIVSSGLASRNHGLSAILENMKSEGKRATLSAWQRLSILQDIAVIAPMIGLLGTVIGLFYAFYDLNRSFNSIDNLLDGLGISVGTTVAGIAVAVLSMILHSGAKFKLVQTLAKVETEASSLAHLMNENT